MQAVIPPSHDQLRAPGQVPLMKFEIEVGAANWINLCSHGGKNYVQEVSISLGGASMTPNPVGGRWSATLFNKDGIFHPIHPTSAESGYLVTGRKVRISIGAKYGLANYYYQRIIGYMDEPIFSVPDYRVNISGGDYMKFLEDAQFQELDATYSNYWGTSQLDNSFPSDGLSGSEIYTLENDAMTYPAEGEANNVDNWAATDCTFVDIIDVDGGSAFVGRLDTIVGVAGIIKNTDVGNGVAASLYRFRLKHRGVGEDGLVPIMVQVHQDAGLCAQQAYYPTDDWTEQTLEFTALDNTALQIWIICPVGIGELRLDQFSIFLYVPIAERFYQLPGASKGPYHVTLDDDGAGAVKVEQGEEDEGWYHEESTKRVFFDRNKTVAERANAVETFYFIDTDPEDAVARILYFAKVPDPGTGVPYVNEAAAKLAMDNDDPGFAIEKVWFKAGSTYLDAIRMLCERCNYRFYFKYDGTPAFKARPAPGGVEFIFTSPSQIESVSRYQSRSEIKNRVIIKGIKQAEPVNRDESAPSELEGEEHNDASILAYGERTLSITNHLFQDQDSIDHAVTGMCIILLTEYKIPKWYADLSMKYLPVPLELIDDIQWEERLSLTLNETQTGVIRDIKITNHETIYKCEIV